MGRGGCQNSSEVEASLLSPAPHQKGKSQRHLLNLDDALKFRTFSKMLNQKHTSDIIHLNTKN